MSARDEILGTIRRSLGVTGKERPRVTEVENRLVEFLQQYVPAGVSPMCGNSICQDRRFMARWMPRLEAFFHYRNLDVSTLKELCKRWQPEIARGFEKDTKHTALADVYESIEEEIVAAFPFERMAAGSYGLCTPAGRRIPVARLEAIPWAETCVDCKQRVERRR